MKVYIPEKQIYLTKIDSWNGRPLKNCWSSLQNFVKGATKLHYIAFFMRVHYFVQYGFL